MIQKAFFEAAFVVFGVVLALGANEWRESVAAQRAADRALDGVLQELSANEQAIREAHAYHGDLLGAIIERGRAGEETSIEMFPGGFMKPADLSDSAWVSASRTGALAEFDYETVLTLSDIYDRQQRYHEQTQSAAAIIYRELYDQGARDFARNGEGIMTLISSAHYYETSLLALYEEKRSALEAR